MPVDHPIRGVKLIARVSETADQHHRAAGGPGEPGEAGGKANEEGGVAQLDGRLKVKDWIFAINGFDVKDMPYSEVIEFIKSAEGPIDLIVAARRRTKSIKASGDSSTDVAVASPPPTLAQPSVVAT